jgi:DNA polymerase-3 subunit beta
MLVTINANEFKTAVKKLAIVSTAKGTLSITGAIQCVYDGEGVFTMTTTNLYQQHTIRFNGVCTGNQPCKFTINCNKVNKLLTCIKTTNVVMEYDEQSNKVVLHIGAKITFDSLTADDFYEFDVSAEPTASLMFLQSSLKTALDKVFWASEKKDDHRKVLLGICFDINTDDKTVTMVATNSKYLATYTVKSPHSAILTGSSSKIVIPNDAVKSIDTLDGAVVSVQFTDNYATFTSGNDIFITKIIEGCFPNYKMVIPEKTMYVYSTDTTQFIKEFKSVQKIIKVMEVESPKIKFTLSDVDVKMTVLVHSYMTRTADKEAGIEQIVHLPYVTTEHLPVGFEFAFNPELLVDILTSFEGEITWGINSDTSPFVFTGDDNYKVIGMPMPLKPDTED